MVDIVDRTAKHANNFGALRLLFAALVVISHSPELVDGNRSRELLTQIFGTMSLGEVAVDAFFLISGYLITQSFSRTPMILDFLTKRIGRILPGYILSSTLCFFCLAPMVGANVSVFSASGLRQFVAQSSRLLPPEVSGVFHNLPYPLLNGSMWTIAYEFRCYIAVAMFGLIFGHRPKAVSFLIVGVLLAFAVLFTGIAADFHVPSTFERTFGDVAPGIRFAAVFGTGSLFYLFRNRIPFSGRGAVVAAVLLTAGMIHHRTAEPSFAVFGGYLIFYFALWAPVVALSNWSNRVDVSYGLYLYAWPVGNTIIYMDRNIDPWLLCALTLLISILLGMASWVVIEKPAIKLTHRLGGAYVRLRSASAAAAT